MTKEAKKPAAKAASAKPTAKKAPAPKADAPKKVAAKASPAKEAKAPAADAPKYGIQDLAKMLDLKEASVRVKLRNSNVAKSGKSYGWNNKADLEAVAKQLSTKDAA